MTLIFSKMYANLKAKGCENNLALSGFDQDNLVNRLGIISLASKLAYTFKLHINL